MGQVSDFHAELVHQICSNSVYHIIYCTLDSSILKIAHLKIFHNLHRTVMETGLFPRANAERAEGDVQRAV
jgi:hypothetical protein